MVSESVPANASIQRNLHMSHLVARRLGDMGWSNKHWLGGNQLNTAREPIENGDCALYEVWTHILTPGILLMHAETLEYRFHMIVVCKVSVCGGAVVSHQMSPRSHANIPAVWDR